MPRHLRLGELLLAIQGIAIGRTIFSGDDADITARIAEIGETLAGLGSRDPEALERLGVTVTEHDARTGYRVWASSYDEGTNPLIDVEEATLVGLLDRIEAGVAIDVGCGTGRVLRLLADRGHSVTGIDQSPEMLTLAGLRVPQATLVSASVGTFDDGPAFAAVAGHTADLVTCALTLTHVEHLDEAIADIARLLRPGGQAIITDMHPLAVLLDGQAVFNLDGGDSAFVRNHVHLHSDYLRAFDAAGLRVLACREPVVTPGRGPLLGLGAQVRPQAAEAAYLGLPYVLVWHLQRPC